MLDPVAITGNIDGVFFTPVHLVIRGWAYDPQTKNGVSAVVKSGGAPIQFLSTVMERPDVQKKCDIGGSSVGFEIKVPLSELKPDRPIQLTVEAPPARIADGALHARHLKVLDGPQDSDVVELVLNFSTRPSDRNYLLFAAKRLFRNKRLLKRTRAGCLCVWGYRIIESDWPDKSELKVEVGEFLAASQQILGELEAALNVENQMVRWITSVRLCRAWCQIFVGNRSHAKKDFAAIQKYLHYLASEPGLILTLVNSAFMLGLLAFTDRNRVEARTHWTATVNVAQLAIGNQRFGLSYYQYDEVSYAMVAARNAQYMLAKMRAESGEAVPNIHLPSGDRFDLNGMFRPIPQFNKLGLLDAPSVTVDQVSQEKDKYEQMWNLPAYRDNHSNVSQVDSFISLTSMPLGASILDIGCGPGYATKRFSERGMKSLGIDIASNALSEENRDLPFLRSAIWEIPARIEADYGFCTDMMEHIPPDQVDKTLLAIRRAVKNEVYFEISLRKDYSGALIGQQLHLTVNTSQWWIEKLREYWAEAIVLSINEADQSAVFLAKPMAGTMPS